MTSETISEYTEPVQRGPYGNAESYSIKHILVAYNNEGLGAIEQQQSENYKAHLAKFPSHKIGKELFMKAKCNCIKYDKWRKCADTLEAQFKEYMKALKFIYSFDIWID